MSEQQHPFRGPQTPPVGETDEDEVAPPGPPTASTCAASSAACSCSTA